MANMMLQADLAETLPLEEVAVMTRRRWAAAVEALKTPALSPAGTISL
jgi:hypothetical protein